MPMWRCPHCGTPQAETARCWVCHRSSTACGTCRNFRRSVAAQLGYCGLDRQRLPLHGDEIRACWEAAALAPDVSPVGVRPSHEAEQVRTAVQRIEFVEVRTPAIAAKAAAAAPAVVTAQATPTMPTVVAPQVAPTAPAVGPEVVQTAPAVAPAIIEPPVAVRGADPGWSLWSDAEL